MKIKNQFTALIFFIIAIPFLCAFFIFINHYLRSSNRYLVEGYKEIRKMDGNLISSSDMTIIKKIVQNLPPDVESSLITESGLIVVSNIKEFPIAQTITMPELWNTIKDTSEQYFYQFTTVHLENTKTTMISRTNRAKKNNRRKTFFLPYLFTMLFILVFISIIIIFFISKNIFNSIIIIEQKSLKLAEGDLNTPVIPCKEIGSLNEITSILQCLEKMRLSLIDVQNRKDKLIMGISHDLRTPVAIIKGYTEAISDGIITDQKEIKQSLNLISTKTNQLEQMIDTLINYMKLNVMELRETMTVSSITDLINNFAKESEIISNVYKRTFISEINFENKTIKVPLNEQLVNRAFENILQNALRYTNDNDTISLISYIRNSSVIFIIKDTGIGINEKDLKNIFDLFYRATTSRKEVGMGIGLSVVKNIIETHNWQIDVQSIKGSGTSFIITIPFTDSQDSL